MLDEPSLGPDVHRAFALAVRAYVLEPDPGRPVPARPRLQIVPRCYGLVTRA
jgi:hypothetical protein